MTTKIFQWDPFAKESGEDIFQDNLPANFNLESAKANLQGVYNPEDLTWLSKLTPRFGKKHNIICSNLLRHFESKFGFIRAFHCTNVQSVESIYSKGLKRLDFDSQHALFKTEYSERLSEAIIREAIEKTNKYYDKIGSYIEIRKQIYFYLNEQYALENGNEFYDGGSEYYRSMQKHSQSHLPEIFDRRGIPTIFALNIPLNYLDKRSLKWIVQKMATKWAHTVIYNEIYDKFSGIIAIDRDLPASLIDYHIHPLKSAILKTSRIVYCDQCEKNINA